MKDSLELFNKSLEEYVNSKNIQNSLLELLESVYRDLQFERKINQNLHQQLNSLMKGDQFGLTSKFVALKEEYATLKEQTSILKNENEDLHIQLIAKEEQAKQMLAEKEEELKANFTAEMKHKDNELKLKQQQLVSCREEFKIKEQELYNEIQAIQASSAIQVDQAEAKYKKQLDDANKKLKDNMATCSNLRIQLMTVKEQLCDHKNESNQKIAALQKRLQESRSGGKLSEDVVCVDDGLQETGRYQPLEIRCTGLAKTETTPLNLKKAPVHRASSSFISKRIPTKPELPPLMQLQDAVPKEKGKKRKLYNPDDLTYLAADNENK